MIIKENTNHKITNAKNVIDIMQGIYKTRPEEEQHKEYFYTIGLNIKGIVQYIDLSGFGTFDQSAVYPREVWRMAILKNVKSIILVHNHPSGIVEPSPQDKVLTQKIRTGCDQLEINMLDHVILGGNTKYFSFSESGFCSF